LLPVLANLVTNTSEALGDHAVAFLALVTIMELCDLAARRHVDPEHFRSCIQRHAELYKRLFGILYIYKKNHYAFHLPDQLIECIMYLLNCWALERKHRVPKRFGNQVTNPQRDYDVSVHREVTMQHIESLKIEPLHFNERPHLINPHKLSKRMQQRINLNGIPADAFEIAASAKFNAHDKCAVGDVVFLRPDIGMPFAAGKVKMLIALANQCEEVAALVECWQYVHSTSTARCTKWTTSDAPLNFFMASDILAVGIWSQTGAVASLLVPHTMK